MAPPELVTPVKLLIAILWSTADSLAAALQELEKNWGAIDHSGADIPFEITDYYQAEMGLDLKRRLVTCDPLIPPEAIRHYKLRCNQLEAELASSRGRTVNLDLGFLDHNKLVLASCKYAGQKIHLGDGIYADLIARYEGGRYQPFAWSFPDFKDGRYDEDLLQIRQRYLQQLRAWRASVPSS
ncbi:MAG: DUF4416 family protein [Planctomycetota bacterium]